MVVRTSIEVRREISKRGDSVIVKEVETTTTYEPGKEPEVREVTRVEEFKGEEGMKRLPPEVRRQLESSSEPNQNPGTSATPGSEKATRGDFLNRCLSAHNKFRKLHGVDPLRISEELVNLSIARAKELAEKDELIPRSDQTYGENLSCLWSSDPNHCASAEDIVKKWYEEGSDYRYDIEPQDLDCGHFTQLIWNNTKEIGIAAAKSRSNKIFVVALYNPPGNYVGEFRNNVFNPDGNSNRSKARKPDVSLPSYSLPNKSVVDNRAFNSKHDMTSSSRGSKSDKTSGQGIDELNKECVAVHNQYRSRHGVPDLKFSKQLAVYAQEWADELAKKNKFEHRKERKYGENLYSSFNSNPEVVATAGDACKNWYNEIQLYDYSNSPKVSATGHFTQMIWKGTTEVGMGRAKSKSGNQIIVANYNPPGNVVGQYVENVPRPK